MGVRLSIDKHVSNLPELLEMSAQYFQKVRFTSKISDEIKQHLKVSKKKPELALDQPSLGRLRLTF